MMDSRDRSLKEIYEEMKHLVERLCPPDWNPSEEEFAEIAGDFIIVGISEDHKKMEQGKERLYLEAIEEGEGEAKQAR